MLRGEPADENQIALLLTSRPKRSRFCHIFLVQSLVWKYCLKLEGCLHNFFLIGPYSAAAEPNSAPKIVTQFLEPSLVLLRRFCLNVRTLRMPLNPRNHRCRYTLHSWSLVTWRQFLNQLTGYYQNLRVEKNVIAMRLQPFGMKD